MRFIVVTIFSFLFVIGICVSPVQSQEGETNDNLKDIADTIGEIVDNKINLDEAVVRLARLQQQIHIEQKIESSAYERLKSNCVSTQTENPEAFQKQLSKVSSTAEAKKAILSRVNAEVSAHKKSVALVRNALKTTESQLSSLVAAEAADKSIAQKRFSDNKDYLDTVGEVSQSLWAMKSASFLQVHSMVQQGRRGADSLTLSSSNISSDDVGAAPHLSPSQKAAALTGDGDNSAVQLLDGLTNKTLQLQAQAKLKAEKAQFFAAERGSVPRRQDLLNITDGHRARSKQKAQVVRLEDMLQVLRKSLISLAPPQEEQQQQAAEVPLVGTTLAGHALKLRAKLKQLENRGIDLGRSQEGARADADVAQQRSAAAADELNAVRGFKEAFTQGCEAIKAQHETARSNRLRALVLLKQALALVKAPHSADAADSVRQSVRQLRGQRLEDEEGVRAEVVALVNQELQVHVGAVCSYTVLPGEGMEFVADRFGVPPPVLVAANVDNDRGVLAKLSPSARMYPPLGTQVVVPLRLLRKAALKGPRPGVAAGSSLSLCHWVAPVNATVPTVTLPASLPGGKNSSKSHSSSIGWQLEAAEKGAAAAALAGKTRAHICEASCGHGICKQGGRVCDCNPGYTGKWCSIKMCPFPSCSQRGWCQDGVCVCEPGYSGPSCSKFSKTAPALL